MVINRMHGAYNKSRRYQPIRYISVHYTATDAPAANNCRYFGSGNRDASADYFIDDTGIYEYNDPAEGFYTWAVGDGHGRYGISNANTVHIEVVNSGGDFSAREVAYLTELVGHLMARFGVPPENVVRHWDASRKHCPAGYVEHAHWHELWLAITASARASAPEPQPLPKEDDVIPIDNHGGDFRRLFDPKTGNHHFTASPAERDGLVKAGWRDEGLGWRAPKAGCVAVWRLCNPANGDHLYTASYTEAEALEDGGWRAESVPFFGLDSGGTEVHRLLDPRSGLHHFTASAKERDSLVKAGWRHEGTAFRVV